MSDTRVAFPVLSGPRRGAAAALALVGLAVAGLLVALPFEATHPVWVAMLALGLAGGVMLDRLATHHPHGQFGLGNAITLVRCGGTVIFLALCLEPGPVAAHGWLAFSGAALLLSLDGVDGWAARRQGLTSAFGARFDMEIDALLILALSGLVFTLGKVDAWVIGLGLMRYVFVVAGWIMPRLARPLPPSERRRVVCGLQVASLGLLLAPPVGAGAATIVAAAAFVALAASFAADVVWLLRQKP